MSSINLTDSVTKSSSARSGLSTAVFIRAAKVPVSLVLIVALGLFLRVYHLGFKPLWLDEAMLFWIANGDLNHVLEHNAAYNSAPPLFPLLVSALIPLSASEAALRAISCAAGIVAIPAIFFLGKHFLTDGWAAFAALLVAVAPTQIKYSQEVREYSITFLLAIALLLLFVRFVQQRTWRRALLFALVVSVSIMTQYGLALLFCALNLAFFALIFKTEGRERAFMQWLAVGFVALLATLIVYHLSLKAHWVPGGRAAYYLSTGYWDGSLALLLRMLSLNTEEIFQFAFPTALIMLPCVVGVAAAFRDRRQRLALWLLIAPLAVTFFMAVLRAYPYLGHRQDIYLTPMIYVFAALGMESLARQTTSKTAMAILFGLIIGYGLRHTVSYLKRTPANIRPVVAKVMSSASPDQPIYVSSGAAPAFAYYARGAERPWIAAVNRHQEPEEHLRGLDRILAARTDVWLVFSDTGQKEVEETLMYISARRGVDLVQEEEGARLYLARQRADGSR